MSRKIVDQTRSTPVLRHKGYFVYEYPGREAMAVREGPTMGPAVGRSTCQNFGNIRDYSEKIRDLLEQMEAFSAMLFPSLPPCLAPGGGYATTLAPFASPASARRRALA